MASCACATNKEDTSLFQSWGHSSVVSPWGKNLVETGHDEAILYADINLAEVKEMREQIMVMHQKRNDIYELVRKVWTSLIEFYF